MHVLLHVVVCDMCWRLEVKCDGFVVYVLRTLVVVLVRMKCDAPSV